MPSERAAELAAMMPLFLVYDSTNCVGQRGHACYDAAGGPCGCICTGMNHGPAAGRRSATPMSSADVAGLCRRGSSVYPRGRHIARVRAVIPDRWTEADIGRGIINDLEPELEPDPLAQMRPDGVPLADYRAYLDRREADLDAEPAHITEISVPTLGDDGIQRLHSHMREPEPLPEAEPLAEAEAELEVEL